MNSNGIGMLVLEMLTLEFILNRLGLSSRFLDPTPVESLGLKWL